MRVAVIAAVGLVLGCGPGWAKIDDPFAEFPAGQISRSPSVPPNLSAPNAKAYRTRIREGVRGAANFAGHFNLIEWGCGTSCATGAVVDRLSGHIVLLPSICCTQHWSDGFESIRWRLDSRLIVMSGLINEEGADAIHYFTVDGGEIREVKSIPFAEEASKLVPIQTQENKASEADCKVIASAVARLDCYDQANKR